MINQYRVFQIKEVHHQNWGKSFTQKEEEGFSTPQQKYHRAYKKKARPR